jgi:hypothetical protein
MQNLDDVRNWVALFSSGSGYRKGQNELSNKRAHFK